MGLKSEVAGVFDVGVTPCAVGIAARPCEAQDGKDEGRAEGEADEGGGEKPEWEIGIGGGHGVGW